MTSKEKELLEAHSVVVNYKKGETICKQGSIASHVMFIEKGLAKAYIENGSKLLVLKIIPEGSLMGLTSVNEEHKTFQYSAMAYIDSVVKQIDIQFFKKLLNENPCFSKYIIDVISSNSTQVNWRFFCMTHKQSYGRLADILLCLANRIFKSSDFDLPLSRKDLAELSGLSPETVIRMLKQFQEEGLIRLESKRIRILDYDRLLHISENG